MRRNPLEWVVLGVSVAALAVLVVVLVVAGLTRPDSPPSPVVRLQSDQAMETAAGWVVPAEVVNDGGRPAVVVQLEASAMVEGEEVVVSADVDRLSVDGSVTVTFVFPSRPEGAVEARTVSFQEP